MSEELIRVALLIRAGVIETGEYLESEIVRRFGKKVFEKLKNPDIFTNLGFGKIYKEERITDAIRTICSQ